MIADNLKIVEKNVQTACAKVGRAREDVTVVAVSKNNPPERILTAYTAGYRHFGENRVQELLGKIPQLPEDIKWHLIGHLQRNKVKYIIDKVVMIHSVDSIGLAEEISKEATKRGLMIDILIEVNIANESTKYGVATEETVHLIEQAAKLPGIKVAGLMTIAPLAVNAEDNRIYFTGLKQLSVDMTAKNIDNISMDVISMGMSGDYMVAIEEGASIIRVGTGIFKD